MPSRTKKLRKTAAQVNRRNDSSALPHHSQDTGFRLAQEVSISAEGQLTSSTSLPPSLYTSDSTTTESGTVVNAPSTTPDNINPSHPSSTPLKKEKPGPAPSQTTLLVNEFEEAMPWLLKLVLASKSQTNGLNDACACGQGRRVVTCYDCVQHPITCPSCFITSHLDNPLHWANLWVDKLSCYVRHDLSALDPRFAINLGHSGHECPLASQDSSNRPIDMTLVAVNGIHRTRVRFCACRGLPNRVEQLTDAGFFPATLKTPRTAFSYSVLHYFHLLQLESKAAAYDYCSTLRRLTDNVFTDQVPDVYPQFIVVMQIWRVLKATIRLGQAHDIDQHLPHRNPGNLIVHCPVCPEPHFNINGDWSAIPSTLRHLCQLQLTADGNHHANRYSKNTDLLSRSLFAGRAYYASEEELLAYKSRLPNQGAEKSTCTHLNASEKQDRKKFKNMDITGIVNIQCSHVFVKSSVDLVLGEKFSDTDLGYARALQLYRVLNILNISLQHVTSRDLVLSYDILCGYLRNLVARFKVTFPSLVDVVARTRGIIPAVHIQNHQESCMYLFSGAYTPNVGHFHGETAEQYWVELNQLGPQVRQMNNGHRQDVIIDSHGDWNWKKTKQMHLTLTAELNHARDTYQQHKFRFQALSTLHSSKISRWNLLDRESRTIHGKDVECVYRQSTHRIPSQQSILEALTKTESAARATSEPKASSEVGFLSEGISIQAAQRELGNKVTAHESHPLVTLQKEIAEEDSKLQKRIECWRIEQRHVMSQESLFLPSDYTAPQRFQLNLVALGSLESQLREGVAFDAIKTIQQYVKSVDALVVDKRSKCRGQDQHTRANAQIIRVSAQRSSWIEHYNTNREALIVLGQMQNARSFPHLRIEDTYRRSAVAKRALGDSRRLDGMLWTLDSCLTTPTPTSSSSTYAPRSLLGDVSTQGSKKVLKRKASSESVRGESKDSTKNPNAGSNDVEMDGLARGSDISKAIGIEDGWIWRLGSIGKLSDTEIQAWEEEGDRVHWFRAEAEMERWREQWEMKLIEFVRCIQSFSAMADTWSKIAATTDSFPHRSYAYKKSTMYSQMCQAVEVAFVAIQSSEPTRYLSGEDITKFIMRHRMAELSGFHVDYTVRLLAACQDEDSLSTTRLVD